MSRRASSGALFICPDYISHFYPMSAIASECRRRGMTVTFATGHALKERVTALGFAHAPLVLGPGSNSGSSDGQEAMDNQTAHMKAFFEATKAGPIETLLYQSRAREYDMLWRPEQVYSRLRDLVSSLRPDYVVVDQLAFGANLALHALQIPFASFLPANPSSLPGNGEVFGLPARLPTYLEPAGAEWDQLRRVCVDTDARFTHRFNDVLARIAPHAPPVGSAFRFTSSWLVLLNYPFALGHHRLNLIPDQAHFIGSSVRAENTNRFFETSVATLDGRRPTVYVSLGTFLSAREDVLGSIARAVQRIGAQGIMATGSAGSRVTSALPEDWLTAPVLPQIAAVRHCDLVVSHGGNNTVTESLAQGVPLLVAPFSSDQFDSAADLETTRLGSVFDPNNIDEAALADQIATVLGEASFRQSALELSQVLQARPGYELATDLLSNTFEPGTGKTASLPAAN